MRENDCNYNRSYRRVHCGAVNGIQDRQSTEWMSKKLLAAAMEICPCALGKPAKACKVLAHVR
jgi:hypothetical protein